MAGPSMPMRSAGVPDSMALGRAPRDGDFAKLLEAASEPAAHRLQSLDDGRTAGVAEDAETRAARATRFGGSPPRPVDAPTDADGAPPSATQEAAPSRFGGRPPGPIGPPGMAAGRTGMPGRSPRNPGDATDAAAPSPNAGPPDLAGLAGRALRAWSARPPKDRLVIALFAIGGAWMVLTIVSASLAGSDTGVGTLVVLALIAFFVLGGRRRRRRPDDADG